MMNACLKLGLCGAVILFIVSCITTSQRDLHHAHAPKTSDTSSRVLVVTDAEWQFYEQVITGIHIASQGNYSIWQMDAQDYGQQAFLEHFLALKPRALIALGPRSAHLVSSSRVLLPSVFSMVPRIENYELGNVFIAGVRMVPDSKDQVGLIRRLLPTVKGVGVVFSRYHSRHAMHKVRSICDDEQFDLINMEVTSKSDVLPALRRSIKEFGAVLMVDDPVLLDKDVLRDMAEFLAAQKVAFFALDCSMVALGAMASFGTNFFSLGSELMSMVSADVPPPMYGSTEIKNPEQADLCINLAVINQRSDAEHIINRAVNFAAERDHLLRSYR